MQRFAVHSCCLGRRKWKTYWYIPYSMLHPDSEHIGMFILLKWLNLYDRKLFFCSTHMQDLQEVTQEVHYENYRSERLAKGAPVPKRQT
jgi:septin family protein